MTRKYRIRKLPFQRFRPWQITFPDGSTQSFGSWFAAVLYIEQIAATRRLRTALRGVRRFA